MDKNDPHTIDGAAGAAAGASSGSGAAVSAAGPAGYVNPDGTLAENWLQHSAIAPEYRADKDLAAIRTVPDMVGKIYNLNRALGKKRAVVPDPANKAEVEEFYAAGGWPKEGPDKYPTVPLPADMPQGMAFNADEEKAFAKVLHDAHLTVDQYAAVMQATRAATIAAWKNQQTDAASATETARAQFRTAHGANADRDIQLAQTAIAAFVPADRLATMRQKGMLEDPDILELAIAVGRAVSPDRLNARSDGGINAAGIEAQITEIMGSDVYLKEKGPRHDAAVARVMQLRDQLRAAQAK